MLTCRPLGWGTARRSGWALRWGFARCLAWLFCGDVVFVYNGFGPVNHQRVRIVRRQCPGEMDGVVFLNACGFGLSVNLHFHIRRVGCIEFCFAGDERYL